MVWVPRGLFTMGKNGPHGVDNGWTEHQPERGVKVGGFWLYKYPLTNASYARFLEANPEHEKPSQWENRRFNSPRQPVVDIRWSDIFAYCQWSGTCLPTEAEWEFAARGEESRKFPWGEAQPTEQLATFGLSNVDSVPKSVDACPKGVSWCGAFDMAGNVWECCSDCYVDGGMGPTSYVIDPVGSQVHGVTRGGGRMGHEYDLYNWCRNGGLKLPIRNPPIGIDRIIFNWIQPGWQEIGTWRLGQNVGFRPAING